MWIITLLTITFFVYFSMLTIGAKADEESEKILQKMLVKKIKAQRKHKMLCEKILENYERKKGTVWEKAKEEKATEASTIL